MPVRGPHTANVANPVTLKLFIVALSTELLNPKPCPQSANPGAITVPNGILLSSLKQVL